MSNPMVKALDDIEDEIGPQILKAFFEKDDFYLCSSPINMRTRIQEEVLERRVLVDMDLVGGTEVFIPLDSQHVTIEQIDPMTVMYHVGSELTQNRPIRQIYSVHFGILNYSVVGGIRANESAMGNEMRKVLDSALRTPPAATTYINMVNHNTFIVKYSYLPYSAAFLRCRLGNDDELTFVRSQAVHDFSELCLLATQAYIFSRYEIAIGQAYLSGGQELGAFGDRVRRWEDKWTEYRAKLKVWKNVAQNFNDPESRRRNLRTVIGAI